MARGAKAAPHLVNAWAVDNGLCPGQQQTAEKSNEITAVPLLLRQLELAGCIATVDALNTQKTIAREIREADAGHGADSFLHPTSELEGVTVERVIDDEDFHVRMCVGFRLGF